MSVINILFISIVLLILSFFLYKKKDFVIGKMDMLAIAFGALALTASSFLVVTQKTGGTILQAVYGWPHFYLIHNIKDVVSGELIRMLNSDLEWNFISGNLFIYPISNFIFYLSVVLFFYLIIRLFIKSEKKVTVGLLLMIAVLATPLMASQKIKELYIKQEIKQANYCEVDSDCENALRLGGGQCPFGCSAYVNRNEAGRIRSLINSFYSTCVYQCILCANIDIKCENNKCQSLCADASEKNADSVEDVVVPLSITEELEIKFKSIVKNVDVSFQDDSFLWWNDNDGYSILIPGTESVTASRDNWASEDFIKNNFSRDLLKIANQVLIERGFILNEQNSSLNEDDKRFYDYIQSYEKGEDLCVVRADPDYNSHECGEDTFMCRTVEITCGNDLIGSQAEQMPFLKAMDLRNKETIVRIRDHVGDYYLVGVGHRRTGSSAVLKKENGELRLLYISQEDPFCELLDKENIPSKVLSSFGIRGCWTEAGYRKIND